MCYGIYPGVGKDTIAKKAIEQLNGQVKFLVSHTTRPMRNNEKEGREYYFIENKDFLKMKEYNGFIETRVYYTKVEENGEIKDATWMYGLSVQEVESCEYGLFIVDAGGFEELKAKYGKNVVIPIYIRVDEEELKNRLEKRGDLKEEVERRLQDDIQKFRSFRVKTVYKTVKNDNLDKAVDELVAYIKEEMGELKPCKKKK